VVITVVPNSSKVAIHERDFLQEKAWGLSFTETSHTPGEDFPQGNPQGKSLEDFLQIHLQVNILVLC
jgi:hypothetical protein